MTDSDGLDEIITRPGKFEGERAILEKAYDLYLEGFYDETQEGVIIVDVSRGTRREKIRFVVDDYGFVCEVQ